MTIKWKFISALLHLLVCLVFLLLICYTIYGRTILPADDHQNCIWHGIWWAQNNDLLCFFLYSLIAGISTLFHFKFLVVGADWSGIVFKINSSTYLKWIWFIFLFSLLEWVSGSLTKTWNRSCRSQSADEMANLILEFQTPTTNRCAVMREKCYFQTGHTIDTLQ